MKHKHVPQRTCVVCRQVKAKRELVRIVRGLDGRIYVDETGKRPGRGAYLCRDHTCWEKEAGGSRLAHALKTTLTEADYETLLAYARQLPDVRPQDTVEGKDGPQQSATIPD